MRKNKSVLSLPQWLKATLLVYSMIYICLLLFITLYSLDQGCFICSKSSWIEWKSYFSNPIIIYIYVALFWPLVISLYFILKNIYKKYTL